jgi:hypothetical protein
MRLLYSGNKILEDLFSSSIRSIRQSSKDESSAKGTFRFLSNDRVSEEDIVSNLSANCVRACRGKYVLSIQDSSEINLSSHSNRIKKDENIGITNAKGEQGLGFMIHPSLVVDAVDCIPYGYADVKIWNRPLEFKSKFEREYNKLPIEEKESFKWLEVSKNTKTVLKDSVEGMVIVKDRGDIYEQFVTIPDEKTDLLIRARTNRRLKDNTKLISCFSGQAAQGSYEIIVDACQKKKRPKRTATIEIRYKPITIKKLKRYVCLITRLGGWKGYESKRKPGITTLWIGIKNFKMGMQG